MELASLLTILVVAGLILRKWLEYKAYYSPTFADLSFTTSIGRARRKILEKHFKFYNHLPEKSRKIFEFRVARFIASKDFVPRDMAKVSLEMQVLISAAAIQLTFGFPRVFLSYFRYILIYPDQFFSNAGQRYHKGEVNPKAKAIVLSWRHFVEGYASSEGVNLGLHEMAHAMQLENIIMNHEYNFLDEHASELWQGMAAEEIIRIRAGEDSLFRSYGAASQSEFFAVAVELFFERPYDFSVRHPSLYHCMVSLMKQNPLQLYQEL